MQDDTTERHVYRLGPVRRWLAWILFGPFILGGLAAVVFAKPEDRVACAVLAAFFVLFGLGMHRLVTQAWLEVSPNGVRMHQIGSTVETPWTNVERLRMDRGQEAFVTVAAMDGPGPRRLSAGRGTGTYDRMAQGLLFEQRYIPIDAFAWHLRHGLGENLRCFAPHLVAALEAGPPPPRPVVKRRVDWRVWGFVIAILLGFGVLAIAAPKALFMLLNVGWGVLLPLIVWQSGRSAVKAFRAKTWAMVVLSLLFAVMMALETLVIWVGIANRSRARRDESPRQVPGRGAPTTSRANARAGAHDGHGKPSQRQLIS